MDRNDIKRLQDNYTKATRGLPEVLAALGVYTSQLDAFSKARGEETNYRDALNRESRALNGAIGKFGRYLQDVTTNLLSELITLEQEKTIQGMQPLKLEEIYDKSEEETPPMVDPRRLKDAFENGEDEEPEGTKFVKLPTRR